MYFSSQLFQCRYSRRHFAIEDTEQTPTGLHQQVFSAIDILTNFCVLWVIYPAPAATNLISGVASPLYSDISITFKVKTKYLKVLSFALQLMSSYELS